MFKRRCNFAVIRFPRGNDGREEIFPCIKHRASEVHLQALRIDNGNSTLGTSLLDIREDVYRTPFEISLSVAN